MWWAIVEDERDIADGIAFVLTYFQVESQWFSNGKLFLDYLEQNPGNLPEATLLDIRMPVMTGYEVLRHIRASEHLKDLTIVVLSAKGQDDEVKMGLEAGADEYLLKPFNPATLAPSVQAVLTEKHWRNTPDET